MIRATGVEIILRGCMKHGQEDCAQIAKMIMKTIKENKYEQTNE